MGCAFQSRQKRQKKWSGGSGSVLDISEGDSKIERHVPALPLSRDREKMNELQKSLAVYRMVFGQSRQEDLAAFLINCLNKESMDNMMIDLSPPSDEKGPNS